MKAMKERKAARPSEVSVDYRNDSGEWGDWDWCNGGAVSRCVGWKRNAG